MKKCQVCGRNKEDFKNELNKEEVSFSKHQGIIKCEKCIFEYEAEAHSDNKTTSSEQETVDWKQQVTA